MATLATTTRSSIKAAVMMTVAMTSLSACAILTGLSGYDVVDCVGTACDGGSASNSDGADVGALADGPPSNVDAGSDAPFIKDANADGDAPPGIAPLCDFTDPTLALCFAFEGNTTDGSGGAAATLPAAITFGTGQVGQGALFNGLSSNLTVPSAPRTDTFTTATLEAFVRPTAIPVGALERRAVMDSSSRFGLFVVETGFRCSFGGPANILTTTTPLIVGQLTHLACTADGTTMTAYKDGVPVATLPTPALTPSAALTAIGMNDPSGEFFEGMIDELRIYSRARTPIEIAQDSARGR